MVADNLAWAKIFILGVVYCLISHDAGRMAQNLTVMSIYIFGTSTDS
jgi:hypothetical protein